MHKVKSTRFLMTLSSKTHPFTFGASISIHNRALRQVKGVITSMGEPPSAAVPTMIVGK